ncbi:cold-shock protein [Mucilaginibacter robiniae]|uniref:cold-shock protein n=1 Tax=Mucilaginibacter robiniae TaxID=2728022 RepID=UPI002006E610|nr:cold shock domain-containing protein [Mucilaginibacter robiniae]
MSPENIPLGIPKLENLPVDPIRSGTVTFFNESKGYGFIRDAQTQESLFVHVNGIAEQIKEGNTVTFQVEKGAKGLNAVKVKRLAK